MLLSLLVCCTLIGNTVLSDESDEGAGAKAEKKNPSSIELSWKEAKRVLIQSHPDRKNLPAKEIEAIVGVIERASAKDRATELQRLKDNPTDVLDADIISNGFIIYFAKNHDRDPLIALLGLRFPRYIAVDKSEFILAQYLQEEVVIILAESARRTKDEKTRNEIVFALSSALKSTYGYNPAEMAQHDHDAVDSDSWWKRVRAEDVKPEVFLDHVVVWFDKNKGHVEIDTDYAVNFPPRDRGELFRPKTTSPQKPR
jgi:hypothetical protein